MSKFLLIFLFCLLQICESEFYESPEDFRDVSAYCPFRPPAKYNTKYTDRFEEPVDFENVTEVICNEEIRKFHEMKTIKASVKNFTHFDTCEFWVPGGIQIQFIEANLTRFDAGVVIREGCKFPQLHFRSVAISDFNMTKSPIISRNFGNLELFSSWENDYILFRFKRVYPIDLMQNYNFLRKIKEHVPAFFRTKELKFDPFKDENPEIFRSF